MIDYDVKRDKNDRSAKGQLEGQLNADQVSNKRAT